ncbi:MAG: DsbE family thiol:disulfide interchange protein, partial [Haliea sp.]
MAPRLKLFLPLILFLVLAAFLFRGLSLDPMALPSALIDRPLPDFQLTELADDRPLTRADVIGEAALFN